MRGVAAGVLLIGWLAACAGQIPRPTPHQERWAAERWPGVTPEKLEHDRSLFISRCSGCHTLKPPSSHLLDRWPEIIDKMQKRAKITEAEKQDILEYILTVKQMPQEGP